MQGIHPNSELLTQTHIFEGSLGTLLTCDFSGPFCAFLVSAWLCCISETSQHLSFAQSDREILKCEDFALGPRGKCLMPLHESENKTSFSHQSPSVKTVSRTIVQRVLPMYQASTAPTCHLHHLTSSLWSLVRWTWSSHYWTWKARHREVMQPL